MLRGLKRKPIQRNQREARAFPIAAVQLNFISHLPPAPVPVWCSPVLQDVSFYCVTCTWRARSFHTPSPFPAGSVCGAVAAMTLCLQKQRPLPRVTLAGGDGAYTTARIPGGSAVHQITTGIAETHPLG